MTEDSFEWSNGGHFGPWRLHETATAGVLHERFTFFSATSSQSVTGGSTNPLAKGELCRLSLVGNRSISYLTGRCHPTVRRAAVRVADEHWVLALSVVSAVSGDRFFVLESVTQFDQVDAIEVEVADGTGREFALPRHVSAHHR